MIYFVRHGLDDERYIGGYSDVKLLDIGIKQIEDVGEWLSYQSFDIRRIYTSDIVRARESADIIAKYLNLCVLIDERFREQNKGLLNGMERLIAIEKYSEYVFSNDIHVRCPEGESLKDLYLRIKSLLMDISNYNNSLIVTHRGVINMFYYLTYNDKLDLNKNKYNVSHASVHEYDIEKCSIRRIR